MPGWGAVTEPRHRVQYLPRGARVRPAAATAAGQEPNRATSTRSLTTECARRSATVSRPRDATRRSSVSSSWSSSVRARCLRILTRHHAAAVFATIEALEAIRSEEALGHSRTEVLEQELADLRRRRERLLDLAEVDDLARDLASRLRSLAARITQMEAELASATGAREDMLDLRAALSQMTDVAQEVLGERADQGLLRDFYMALRLRVDYDPSTRIASATVTLNRNGGGSVCVRGGTELLSSGDVNCLVRDLNT